MTVEAEKCTGCRNCELACSLAKVGEINPIRSRITVMMFPEESLCIPVTCWHCDQPVCRDACPAGAITKDEVTGIVSVSQGRCIGCRLCLLACPFGAISSSGSSPIEKCDLCGGNPECVAVCQPKAIKFEPAAGFAASRRRVTAARMREALREVGA